MADQTFELLKSTVRDLVRICYDNDARDVSSLIACAINEAVFLDDDQDMILESMFPTDQPDSKDRLINFLAYHVNKLSDEDSRAFAARYQPPEESRKRAKLSMLDNARVRPSTKLNYLTKNHDS